jgi:hypothetical protein
MTTIYRLTEDLAADIASNDSVCFSAEEWMVSSYSGNHDDTAEVVELECPVASDDIATEADVLEYREDDRAQLGALAWELADEAWVRRDLWDRGYRALSYRDTDNGEHGWTECQTVRVMYRRA